DPRTDRASLELCLARAGPGRAEWTAAEARSTSRIRQALGLEAIRDAWERYAEVRWIELAGGHRPALEEEHRALGRERVARAVLELMLAVENTPPDRAAEWIGAAAGLPPDAAHRAVWLAAERPSFAAITAALEGIEALRAEVASEMGTRFRL